MNARSILCPNCNKLISTDEPVCPHCEVSKPGARWKTRVARWSFLGSDRVIMAVIYTNAAMYLISVFLNPSSLDLSANPFRFLSPSNRALFLLGTTGTVPIDEWHRWWTLVSANYLHGGILHILFNMLALRQIGPLVIQEYGVHRMLGVYTLSGIVGFFVSYVAGVRFTLGASAAVCGLIGRQPLLRQE